jgi:hypothetical protein
MHYAHKCEQAVFIGISAICVFHLRLMVVCAPRMRLPIHPHARFVHR